MAIVAALVAAAFQPSAPAFAQISETQVKAAFIPKFARYVTWPTSPRGPILICIIGDDPFGNSIDQASASQSADGRPIAVKRIASAADASSCAIAFVSGPRTGETLAGLGRAPILTITDSRSGPQRGIIHFAIVDGRVRFYIDRAQAEARGLIVSSRLLALAIGVNQK